MLTDKVLHEAQMLLDQGLTRTELSQRLSVSYDAVRKAVKDGRLRMSPSAEKSGTTRTERNVKDADCGLGVACVRVTERILAAAGVLKGARPSSRRTVTSRTEVFSALFLRWLKTDFTVILTEDSSCRTAIVFQINNFIIFLKNYL